MPYVSARRKKSPPRRGGLFHGIIGLMKETCIVRENDMDGLAFKVAEILISGQSLHAKVVLLEGDLGVGKTTFTKALAHVLGIEKDTVQSPTFILKKEYNTDHMVYKKMIHVDAYRFTHPSEAKVLRLEEDLKNPENVVVVEWPSKMHYLASDVLLDFTVLDDETREVEITYGKK